MKQEFFTNIPSEIIIDILSRLPVRTIISCKCVCKSWLYLVQTHEFAKSHLSKSAPGLAIIQSGVQSDAYRIFEFKDGHDLELHQLHYNHLIKFDFPHVKVTPGSVTSVNGLLFLCDFGRHSPDGLYICNPITRGYIELCCPREFICSWPQVAIHGFGESKMTNQHKVVRIFNDYVWDQKTFKLLRPTKSECQVYILGTGSWRNIDPCAPFEYSSRSAFLNGNLHWLVCDLNGTPWISCFDLETEVFSTFSLPPLLRHKKFHVNMCALEGCLCLSDSTSNDNEIVIWLMKEYGVDKSWTKEFVISRNPDLVCFDVLNPIKVFKDGDILMAWKDVHLFYYSNKTKTIEEIDISELKMAGRVAAVLHTSSFISLKSFGMENEGREVFVADMFALGDCLCLCDNGSNNEIVIWLMKEYGVEKSWTKEFVVSKIPNFDGESYEVVCPIKVFRDGDILMAWEGWLLAYYSNKTRTIQQVDAFALHTCYINAVVHTPSFLSLKSFEMENVSSF